VGVLKRLEAGDALMCRSRAGTARELIIAILMPCRISVEGPAAALAARNRGWQPRVTLPGGQRLPSA
jgi:hypothetical protein